MNFKQTGDVSLNQRKNVSRFVAEMSLQLRNSKTLKSTKKVSQGNDLCFNSSSFSFPIIKTNFNDLSFCGKRDEHLFLLFKSNEF